MVMTRLPRSASTTLMLAAGCLAIGMLAAPGCGQTTKQPPAKAAGPAVSPAAAAPGPSEKPAAGPAQAPAADAAESAPTIADLVSRLAGVSDSGERVLVVDQIGAIGQNALPALDALVKTLGDEDPRVRWHAARAIGLIGEDARLALPKLVGLLADADPIVVTQAAAAIALIREDDGRATIPEADAASYQATVEPLLKTVVHPDARARRAAMRALARVVGSFSEMAPLLTERLADADPAVVIAAMHTLADMDDDAVPFLVEAVKNPKSRYWAEVALAEIGPEAAAAVGPLAKLAAEGEVEERLQAILTLAAIGEGAKAAVPTLVQAIESGDASLRLPAAFALGQTKAKEADECLSRLTAADDPLLAALASWARARINPADEAVVAEAVDRLRKQLASGDPEARSGAVSGLSDLSSGLPAELREELAGDFLGLLADAEPRVGTAAGAALIRLGAPAVGKLRDKIADPTLRLAVMEILSAIGQAAKPALDDLVKAIAEPDPQVRGDAAVAIAAIGADAAAAVPALRKLLEDESVPAAARYPAAFALGRIGPAAAAAEPALRQLASSPDEMMATVAVWAALKIKPDDKSLFESAIPLLRRALRGDREMARLEAAVALGDIGPAAQSAIPILELVAEDDSAKPVRAAAAAALAKIRGR
jgi:HEAT repeat protein